MTTISETQPIFTKKVRIKDINVDGRFRKDFGDLKGLADSIKEVGLLQPPILDENNRCICGARRIEAYAMAYPTEKEISVIIVSLKDILAGEFHENSHRKSFTTTETVEIKKELEKRAAAEAKERQSQAGKTYGRGKIASVNCTEAIDNEHSIDSMENWDPTNPMTLGIR